MTDYQWAPEVEEVAKDVIATVDEHADLADATILYVFRDKATRAKGRMVLGRARQISGLGKFIVTQAPDSIPLFVLEIAKDTWADLTDEQRRALVDHELCHLAVETEDDGTLVGRTRGHDLEEFLGVVERHGLWKADVAALGAAAASKLDQLTFELVTTGADPDDDSNNKGGRP